MSTTAFVLADDFDDSEFGTARAAVRALPRLELDPRDRPGVVADVEPQVLTPGRVMLAHWLAAERWFEFSRGEDLPSDWLTEECHTRCHNCGAPASSACSIACPERLLTSTGNQRLAVQVPCELHQDHGAPAGGDECPHCVGGLVTVAWATVDVAPLQVVDYRYRLRRSKPDQFKLSDGSYHDANPGIEPICLPGRWARGGLIEATTSPGRASGATATAWMSG